MKIEKIGIIIVFCILLNGCGIRNALSSISNEIKNNEELDQKDTDVELLEDIVQASIGNIIEYEKEEIDTQIEDSDTEDIAEKVTEEITEKVTEEVAASDTEQTREDQIEEKTEEKVETVNEQKTESRLFQI